MIILQVMLAVFGVGYLIRAFKARNLDHKLVAGVSRSEFERWQELYIKACYWFTGTSVVVFGLSFYWLPHIKRGDTAHEYFALAVLGFLLLFGIGGHVDAWRAASKFKKSLKTRPGVIWPD